MAAAHASGDSPEDAARQARYRALADMAQTPGLRPVLLAQPADWRWGLRGDRTPWYPHARLFRQAQAGDWASALQAVRQALAERLAGLP